MRSYAVIKLSNHRSNETDKNVANESSIVLIPLSNEKTSADNFRVYAHLKVRRSKLSDITRTKNETSAPPPAVTEFTAS